MRQILLLQNLGTVAGESASAIDTAQINAVVQRAYQSSVQLNQTSTSGAGVNNGFNMPSLSFLSNSSYDVSVVRYNNISNCLSDRGGGGGGSGLTLDDCAELANGAGAGITQPTQFTQIEVTDTNGTVRDVNGLTTAFNFTIDVTVPGTGPRVKCSWWNIRTYSWNTSGCITRFDPATPTVVHCSCTHLTDFAVLLNEDLSRQACVSEVRLTQSITYRIFCGLYGLLAVMAAIPLVRCVSLLFVSHRSCLVSG
jgi:hypothetical protein